MYNRYIPQPDGSYRRNRVNEPVRHDPPPAQPPPCTPERPPCAEEPKAPPCGCRGCQRGRGPAPKREPPRQDPSVSTFLRNLLPKDFDTGDLMIVLLLLLMAGDCAEDQNSALLTLALYFFM